MIENLRRLIVEMQDVIRQKYKAEIKGIFGSYTRSDFHADSDLDLLVDFDDSANLMDYVKLQQFLEDRLECKIDVISRHSRSEEKHFVPLFIMA
ncbi:nucleotidyltransferase domain-containing protein [Candidatus Poribacteria bacterium]|nr:nucleotidyltransferase domain-containing protein [Candidatus Poribacteria bacterium]